LQKGFVAKSVILSYPLRITL